MSITLRFGLFALVVTTAAGCECGSPTTSQDVCALPGAPMSCGALCSPAVPCGPGTHCVDNHCAAECSAAHACLNGARCAPNGTCATIMDGAIATDGARDGNVQPIDVPPTDTTCAAVEVGTTLATPNVIVIVDQSGSMGTNDFPMGSGVHRWDALQNALMANPAGLIHSLQASVRWGMAWYHGGNMCPNNTHTVDCALNNYDAINTQYMALSPGSFTPTGEAINYVIAHLGTIIDDPSQPTIFILATDGDPNTCASSNDTTGGQMRSVAAVTTAFNRTPSIPTYVISVGSDASMANLQAVANAGVGGTGHVYLATNTAMLSDALTTIVGGVVSCNLTLAGTIDPTAACSGGSMVTLAGAPLTCGDPNGWHAIDATHIQLDGTACTTLLGGARPLTATFPCGVIIR
jgi:hypothetical protein